MADLPKIKMWVPPVTKCQFSIAWQGRCNARCDDGYCDKHKKVKCKCGNQATHNCAHAGQFVCGRPLCEDCKHEHRHY